MAAPPLPIDSQKALSSWLLSFFAGAGEDEKQAMIQAMYGLWLARNEARDGVRIAHPQDIVDRVHSHLVEWRNIHAVEDKAPKSRHVQSWEPPVPGWVKVNSDGAVSKQRNSGGGGAVLRDHDGAFRAGVYAISSLKRRILKFLKFLLAGGACSLL